MRHRLDGDAESKDVFLDGHHLDPRNSQKYHNHSSEFNWGYGGSGPAQLALAVTLALTGTSAGYQDFKFAVIAYLPQGKDFEITFEYPPSDDGKGRLDYAVQNIPQEP